MNAKASVASEIIIWIGAFTAVMILALFYLDSFFFSAKPFEKVSFDAEKTVSLINEACLSSEFSALFNPETEEGLLEINDSNVCFSSQEITVCKTALCKINAPVEIDLKETKLLKIIKEGEEINVLQEKV